MHPHHHLIPHVNYHSSFSLPFHAAPCKAGNFLNQPQELLLMSLVLDIKLI